MEHPSKDGEFSKKAGEFQSSSWGVDETLS